jgi:hypothetical protein
LESTDDSLAAPPAAEGDAPADFPSPSALVKAADNTLQND